MNALLKVMLASLLLCTHMQQARAQETTASTARPTDPPTAVASAAAPPEAASAVTAADESKTPGDSGAANKPAAATATADKKNVCDLCRWVDLQTASVGVRYMFIENSTHVVSNNHMQDNVVVRGRLKFDRAGDYSLNFGVTSGNNFALSWNNTGVGTGNFSAALALRHLFVSAKPAKGVEAQYGSIGFNRGESTEITSYDNDGYLTGGRIAVKRPQKLFFDEVAVTYAYVGDLAEPQAFNRFHRFDESNYHQFLVAKRINKRIAASADYTFQSGTETMREAVKVEAAELRAVDSLRVETYQRLDVKPDYGFAISGDKKINKLLALNGGYAQIDRDYGGLNGDRYGRGKHLFVIANVSLDRGFGITGFLTRGIANDFPVGNLTRFEMTVSYNLLRVLRRTRLF